MFVILKTFKVDVSIKSMYQLSKGNNKQIQSIMKEGWDNQQLKISNAIKSKSQKICMITFSTENQIPQFIKNKIPDPKYKYGSPTPTSKKTLKYYAKR